MNRMEAAEISELVKWLEAHPSFSLNGGMNVVVTCPSCGDSVTTSSENALLGVPCVLCETEMEVRRWRDAKRVRRFPYSYGRGWASAPSLPESDPFNENLRRGLAWAFAETGREWVPSGPYVGRIVAHCIHNPPCAGYETVE